MPQPTMPPSLRHLAADMEALHQSLRARTEDGGSTHLHNPADLHAALESLTATLDLVPTITGLLMDHMRAWHERDALVLTPLAPADHTVEEGLEIMTIALSSSTAAQEYAVRSLASLLIVLSHYAPNVAERGPDEPAVSLDDKTTTRDAIRHLQKRVTQGGVTPWQGEYVSEAWLYLMLQVMANALKEGRRADAVKAMTDPSISDGTWRPKLLTLLVDLAELLANVQDNGREGPL